MRVAIDQDGTVINVIEAVSLEAAQAMYPGKTLFVSDSVEKGMYNDGGTYVRPTAPTKEPETLSITKFARICRGPGGMTDELLVAAKEDPLLKAVWITLELSTQVKRDDPEVIPGLTAFNALGYLPNGVNSVLDAWPTK